MTERDVLTRNCRMFGISKIRSASLSRHEQLLVYDPDKGSLQGHARALAWRCQNTSLLSASICPITLCQHCRRRTRKAALALDCNSGGEFITPLGRRSRCSNLYCPPAHVTIHERDNAVSFAC